MQFFYVIAAFFVCAVAPSAAERKRCDQLPTDCDDCDARVQVQPFGKNVLLYKSTAAQQTCQNMSYVGNRNNDTQQGTFILWDSQDNFHIPWKVDVNAEMTSWTLTNDSGVSLKYYKLVLNKASHWWCVYACDAKGEKIMHAFCAVNDDKGKKELDADLAQNYPDKDLPLIEGQTLGVVYAKNCKTKYS